MLGVDRAWTPGGPGGMRLAAGPIGGGVMGRLGADRDEICHRDFTSQTTGMDSLARLLKGEPKPSASPRITQAERL